MAAPQVRTRQAPARAPPLAVRFGRPDEPGPEERTRAIRRAARWVGVAVWAVWSGVLLGTLLGLGRVPWAEAAWWSLASGAVMGRTVESLSRRGLGWLLEQRVLELGPADPQVFRRRVEPCLRRYGYRKSVHSLRSDRYRSVRARGVLPDLRVAWSGPGAVVEGPRFLLRRLARLAVG